MVARVYGRYAPRSDERDRRERIAAERDAVRERRRTRKSAKWVPLRARHLVPIRANHSEVIGSQVAGVGLGSVFGMCRYGNSLPVTLVVRRFGVTPIDTPTDAEVSTAR